MDGLRKLEHTSNVAKKSPTEQNLTSQHISKTMCLISGVMKTFIELISKGVLKCLW